MPFTGSLPRRLDRVFFHQSRTNLVHPVPISYQSRTNIKKCLCPENKSVYVQKIKAYVQKIKGFVSSLHKMEYVIYKEILKSGKPTSGMFLVTFCAVNHLLWKPNIF